MALNFDSILESIGTPVDVNPKARVFDEKFFMWHVNYMKQKGYVFKKHSLEALNKYLQGYPLLLSGSMGTGKTMFFNCVWQKRPIQVIKMATVCAMRLEDIHEQLKEWQYDGLPVLIDDIGAEPKFNNFGEKMELIPFLLEMRIGADARTHFTTNLNEESLRKLYGVRVIDRLYEMAEPVVFTGESMRTCHPKKIEG